MAWPDDRTLPVEVEAAFGADVTADPSTWSWTDMSSRLRAVPATINQRASTGGQMSPSTCTLALHNDDGALTPLHPLSPYWPNVELGTPLRVRLRRAEDGFARTTTSGWGTAPSGQSWTVTGVASNYSVSGDAGLHNYSSVNQPRRSLLDVVLRDCEQVIDVSTSAVSTGSPVGAGVMFRYAPTAADFYWLRVDFTTTGTITLKIVRVVGGIYTDLATLTNVPGLTYTAGTWIRMRASVVGSRLAVKAWSAASTEPAGWQLTTTDTVFTEPGRTGAKSWVLGTNTNTMPLTVRFRDYALRVDRFNGFADQWEPVYLPTGTVGQMSSGVAITASGVLRRLTQGESAAESPMRRTIAASSPVAYWPVEDGIAASQSGPAVPGLPPLAVTGASEFVDIEETKFGATSLLRYGTSRLINLAGGGMMSVALPGSVTTATATNWAVSVAAAVDHLYASGDVVIAEAYTPGSTWVWWQLVYRKTLLRMQVIAYDGLATPTVVIDSPGVYTTFDTYDFGVWQNGGNISVGLGWYLGSYSMTGSVAGTLAGIARLSVNPLRTTQSTPMPFGHVAVWAAQRTPVEEAYTDAAGVFVYGSTTSWWREAATARLARLCAEERVSIDMSAAVANDELERMGWQPAGTFVDLIGECVEVDGGLLWERGFGLTYLPRVARYNRPTDLTINLATYRVGERDSTNVLTPVYDDQDIRNQWKVERRDGSSVVVNDTDSQKRGIYSDTVDLNLASDDRLADHAGWRLHLSTAVDLREDTFPIDLAANPTLIDGWLSCGIGSRIVRTNPPAQYRPGPLDRVVVGWTETLAPNGWTVQVVPQLAEPWDVATADGVQRAPADGSTLAAPLTSAGTSFSLASTSSNGPWTTDPADFPLDVQVGGERITLSAITGSTSPQTATVSARGVNGIQRDWPTGTPVDVWAPATAPL